MSPSLEKQPETALENPSEADDPFASIKEKFEAIDLENGELALHHKKRTALQEVRREKYDLKSEVYSSKRLPDLQKRYDKALNSPPKAPVVLDAETAEEVREEAHRTGHTTKFGNDDVQVILEGQRYTFKPDGRVIAQEDGVATSKEDQIYRLESLQRAIDEMNSITKGRSTDQLLAELEKVSVQYDEMNAQLISEFGESGRIFNRSA